MIIIFCYYIIIIKERKKKHSLGVLEVMHTIHVLSSKYKIHKRQSMKKHRGIKMFEGFLSNTCLNCFDTAVNLEQ